MKFIYGPVKSRRLGVSLGVNLTPFKTCSFDCVYCQLGKTTYSVLERKEFFKAEEIIAELKNFLATADLKSQLINYITLSGSGEPTLNSKIAEIIQGIKKITNIPVAIITNSSLLFKEEVRRDLLAADLIMPTLNAATYETFNKICRPHSQVNLENIVNGLIALRKEFKGKIYLELMLVKGVNDSLKEIEKLKEIVNLINPDKIFLTLPERATSEDWVKPPEAKTLAKIKEILGAKCEIV
ncbi:MAG: radical SAM protein [Candidatus Omnitrophota bacterium]|nr:radical SAM protein [Candidatus Omnitrophota bacterium]